MIEDFNKIIEENMPQMVGDELKKLLQKYENLKETEKELRLEFEASLEVNGELKKELLDFKSKYNKLREKEAELESGIKQVEHDKIWLSNQKLSHELECANKSRNDLYTLSEIVFKNRTITTSKWGSVDEITTDQFGNNITQPKTSSETTTLTED